MSSILDGINQRTQLVGKNRLELLVFRLGDDELYGINVFKVREVIRCPKLTTMHSSHPAVRGIANIRGTTVSIMDLSSAILAPKIENPDESLIIITEFNRSIQGFMVKGVERIVNLNWEDIHLPPKGSEVNSYINAITNVDDQLVQLIDVEKVLNEIIGEPDMVTSVVADKVEISNDQVRCVLVVDDSVVARAQVVYALEQVQVESIQLSDGKQALEKLRQWAADEKPISERISMVISDIEMPEMDGYTLTSEIRRDPRLKDLYVLLHSSLSGVFNENMVEKVGADCFIPKFSADELVEMVLPVIQKPGKNKTEAA